MLSHCKKSPLSTLLACSHYVSEPDCMNPNKTICLSKSYLVCNSLFQPGVEHTVPLRHTHCLTPCLLLLCASHHVLAAPRHPNSISLKSKLEASCSDSL